MVPLVPPALASLRAALVRPAGLRSGSCFQRMPPLAALAALVALLEPFAPLDEPVALLLRVLRALLAPLELALALALALALRFGFVVLCRANAAVALEAHTVELRTERPVRLSWASGGVATQERRASMRNCFSSFRLSSPVEEEDEELKVPLAAFGPADAVAATSARSRPSSFSSSPTRFESVLTCRAATGKARLRA